MTSSASSRFAAGAWFSAAILAIVLAGRTAILVYEMARPVPYWDAWEFMKALPSIFEGRYSLKDLVSFHNEHRILTTRLIMLADLRFFDASGYLSTAVLTILLGIIGCLLGFVAVGRNWGGAVASCLATSLLLSVAQYENYASGFQVQFPLVDLCAIIAIGLFTISCVPGRSFWWVAGAVIADAVAVGSMASGNTVLGPVILVALAMRAPLVRVLAFAVPAVAMTAAFLVGYRSTTPASHDVIRILHFTVNYLGSALSGYPGASLWLGAGLLAAYAVVLSTVFLAWRKKKRLDTVTVWLAGVASFTVAGALVTAAGRLNLGMETAISSRYVLQSLLFATCVFLMAWRWLRAVPNQLGAQLGLAFLWLSLSAFSTLATSPLKEWRDRVALYDVVGDAVANGIFSDWPLSTVYPWPEYIRPALAFMAAHRLGPFSDRYANIYRPPLNAIAGVDINNLPECTSAQDYSKPVGLNGQEVVGWAFSPDRPGENGWVLAFNPEQRLLGFARQATDRPDVSEAYDIVPSRVGYQIVLNTHFKPSEMPTPVTMVIVPNGSDGLACRATPMKAAP